MPATIARQAMAEAAGDSVVLVAEAKAVEDSAAVVTGVVDWVASVVVAEGAAVFRITLGVADSVVVGVVGSDDETANDGLQFTRPFRESTSTGRFQESSVSRLMTDAI